MANKKSTTRKGGTNRTTTELESTDLLFTKQEVEWINDMLVDYRYIIDVTQLKNDEIKIALGEFLKQPDDKLPEGISREQIQADLDRQLEQDKLIELVKTRRESLMEKVRGFLKIEPEPEHAIEGELIPGDTGLHDEDIQSVHEATDASEDVSSNEGHESTSTSGVASTSGQSEGYATEPQGPTEAESAGVSEAATD